MSSPPSPVFVFEQMIWLVLVAQSSRAPSEVLKPATPTVAVSTPSIGAVTANTASRPLLVQPVSVRPVVRLALPEYTEPVHAAPSNARASGSPGQTSSAPAGSSSQSAPHP